MTGPITATQLKALKKAQIVSLIEAEYNALTSEFCKDCDSAGLREFVLSVVEKGEGSFVEGMRKLAEKTPTQPKYFYTTGVKWLHTNDGLRKIKTVETDVIEIPSLWAEWLTQLEYAEI